MNSAAARPARGLDLLLQHCLALARLERGRTHALDRLDAALGDELSRRLVEALAGDHRLPRSRVPACG
jgi:hypothetical protein